LSSNCLFCQLALGDKPDEYVILRENGITAVLDRYPITEGHLLVFPSTHIADSFQVDDPEFERLMKATRRCAAALQKVYGGIRVGFFSSGKIIRDHCHIHVLTIAQGLRFHFRDLSTLTRTAIDLDAMRKVGEPIAQAIREEQISVNG
jgi:diadenosine tetraphosphate (Ap4A) HIT family hydrolase